MCGINGVFSFSPAASAPAEAELLATRDAMASRGPDGHGVWWREDRRLAFAHRRLSIVDLSDRALQPMASADGQIVVTFNGEIYNNPQLRAELEAEGCVYRTTSDTETLLHLYAKLGPAMVSKLRGMFALAIWDGRRQGLFLARDPYGIKPLYYADDGWTYRFASQVKALLAGGAISHEPEPAGVVGFMLFGSVPEPFTSYRDIRALPAGHTQWVDAAGPRPPEPYVNLAQVLAEGRREPTGGDVQTLVRGATLDSVSAHLLADVEVGVFLSAGIDSGALLGLMRDAGQEQVRAITLGFDEFTGTEEDEAPLAAQVAAHYGAQHVVRRVSQAEFHHDLPLIIDAMDQPSIDGVNTWFVSKAAREAGLKVALSGVGGDELLAGYPSFRDIPRWVKWLGGPARVPGAGYAMRRSFTALGIAADRPKLASMLEYGGGYAGAYLLRRGLFLPFEMKTVLDPEFARIGLDRLAAVDGIARSLMPDPGSPTGRVSALESTQYMKNQLLRDADWAGMAHHLEIRTPLVDIELLRRLAPVVHRLAPGEGKRALSQAPSKPLPPEVADRAKTGFVVPTAAWMQSEADRTAGPSKTKGGASRAWSRVVLSRQADAAPVRAA